MLLPSVQANTAPTFAPVRHSRAPILHFMLGTVPAIYSAVQDLQTRGYAERDDWSQPIATGRTNEVVAMLTKQVTLRD